MLASYKRTWESLDTAWTPNMLIGTMMHAGAAATLYGKASDAVMETVLTKGYIEQETHSREWIFDMAQKALKCLTPQLEAIVGCERIIGIEMELMPLAHHPAVDRLSRADLVTQGAEGLIITDYKYSRKLSPQWRLKRLQEYDSSFQLWCYAWQASHLGQVAWIRVFQVIGEPKATLNMTTIRVTPARLAFFERGALAAWEAMAIEVDTGVKPVPNFMSCQGKYGQCQFYAACHEAHGDEAMMEVLYKRVTKQERGSPSCQSLN